MASSPSFPTRIRAVLFDVDGTLYRQPRLRALMAMELLTLPLRSPMTAASRLRALAAYRRAQEDLREAGSGASIPGRQIQAAVEESGLSAPVVENIVNEWMMARPLKYLRWCRAAGIDDLLNDLRARDVRTGVLSDYPAAAKLRALGLEGRFAPVLCTSDPDINVLKPSPVGFHRACEAWSLEPREVLMVGDRVDVDAAGAAAAGMPCVIIGRGQGAGSSLGPHFFLPSLERLRLVLANS